DHLTQPLNGGKVIDLQHALKKFKFGCSDVHGYHRVCKDMDVHPPHRSIAFSTRSLLDQHVAQQQVIGKSLVLRTLETLRDLLQCGGGDQREIQLVLRPAFPYLRMIYFPMKTDAMRNELIQWINNLDDQTL